jgi:hypothetical protein
MYEIFNLTYPEWLEPLQLFFLPLFGFFNGLIALFLVEYVTGFVLFDLAGKIAMKSRRSKI